MKIPQHALIARRDVLAGLALAGGCLLGQSPVAAAPPGAVVPGRVRLREQSTCLFAGRVSKLHLECTDPSAVDTGVWWRWTAGERTLGAGELLLNAEGVAEVALPPVSLKAGLVHSTKLEFGVLNADRDAESLRELWLCSSDAFADRREWLTRLPVRVLDQGGKTSDVFRETQLPFEPVANVKSLDSVSSGVLIIAEECDERSVRGLAESACAAARRGAAVVWFAPLEIPEDTFSAVAPPAIELHLHRETFPTILDKRLNAQTWGQDVSGRRLALEVMRNRPVWRLAQRESGWVFLEAVWPGGGRFLVCGLSLLAHWAEDPTPRYLLLRLLERCAERHSSTAAAKEPGGNAR